MSQKWHHSRRWDDEHLTGVWWPVKVVLRSFSSIAQAVVLLSLVMVYAIFASVPIGLLALAPTYLIYGLTLVGTVGLAVGLPLLALRRMLKGAGRGVRFVVTLFAGLGLAVLGVVLWRMYVWPPLQYDPAGGGGLRLFAGFVERYQSTTVRRLPILEMSELEFYSWWPLRVVLLAFVLNMIVATVRRIEFVFVNLGVLTVHTGIIVIALGSLYYSGLKQEGDTVLLAGNPGADGSPTVGPAQMWFSDNTGVALLLRQRGHQLEQRLLEGVPRYNDYNLGAVGGRTLAEATGLKARAAGGSADGGRTLSIPVPDAVQHGEIDPDLKFRVVGYASYAEPEKDWVRRDAGVGGGVDADGLNPLRVVHLHSDLPDAEGNVSPDPVFAFHFLPETPAERWTGNATLAIEYTRGMAPERWADLSSPLPEGAEHALMVEVPGRGGGGDGAGGYRAVYRVEPGTELVIGPTGYKVTVKELAPEPPFPIITAGYEDAMSSLAIVRVTEPGGSQFDRWVYHRYPEISQDLLDELNERGMPRRRDADAGIRIGYIDASLLQVYFDEDEGGTVRSVVRPPRGVARVVEGLGADGVLEDMVPKVSLRLAERWAHAEEVELPRVVPDAERDKANVGMHTKAMLAVEISSAGAGSGPGAAPGAPWVKTVWLPFTRFGGVAMGTERTIDLPDGRILTMAFARRQHALPGFALQLMDFQMIAYDHRGAPRDYQSLLRVTPTGGTKGSRGGGGGFEGFEHVTKLNAPLQAPFMWSEERPWAKNVAGLLVSRLNPRQFKFSQAGWDQSGWQETQAMADRGELPRAFASFTILGVGNNPGIHVIALGGILVALGIPWAFYVKPWLVQRTKRRIQREVAAGTYRKPGRTSRPEVSGHVVGSVGANA